MEPQFQQRVGLGRGRQVTQKTTAGIALNIVMQLFDVLIQCDVTAKVLDHPFRYRLYVGDELFTERTWTWHGVYLEEIIPIKAPAGIYKIRWETVDPDHGRIKIRNYRVTGPARMTTYQLETALEIRHASQ